MVEFTGVVAALCSITFCIEHSAKWPMNETPLLPVRRGGYDGQPRVPS